MIDKLDFTAHCPSCDEKNDPTNDPFLTLYWTHDGNFVDEAGDSDIRMTCRKCGKDFLWYGRINVIHTGAIKIQEEEES